MKLWLGVLLSLGMATAHADEIVVIKRETNQLVVEYRNRGVLWNLGAGVCLYINQNKATCGRIAKIADNRMLLNLTDDGARRLRNGDYVVLNANNRVPAAIEAKVGLPRHDTVDIGLGVAGGFNYFYPTLKLGFALSRDISLGIEPLYVTFSQATTSVKLYGGFITVNYFFTPPVFRGFYLTGGAGVYSLSLADAGLTENVSPFAFEALLQWRGGGHWSLGLDISLGAGVQYVPTTTVFLTTNFQGVLPLFTLTLGTTF